MNAQQLKNSILQRAIEGRLVSQRPEDGSAKELLEKIKEEKKRLIAEKKIKKAKPLPPISEDEIPFDIPDSWDWVRLGDICLSIADGDHQAPPKASTGVPFLVISNVSKGKLDFTNTRFVPFEYYSRLSPERVAERNDILFTVTGSYGVVVRVETDNIFCFQRHIALIKSTIITDYLLWILNSPLVKKYCDNTATGTAQKTVGLNSLKKMLIPLPPLAEQHRIIAKIKALLPLIDQYDKTYTKLVTFNERFPEMMKKSILQYAIEGKLVEQRKEEGTADELLQQIQAEKKRLIEEKTIKKTKPLPPITDDEIPFDIPEGWKWVRLNDILTKITDGTHHSPPNCEQGKYKYITAKNIKDYGIDETQITFVTEDIHHEIYERCNPEKGDILLIKDGATTGTVTCNNLDEPFSMLSSVALLKCSSFIDAWYIVYALRSDIFYANLRKQMKGTGITRITLKQISPLAIPLPPLAEQHRIVAKIEQLLPLCERLIK